MKRLLLTTSLLLFLVFTGNLYAFSISGSGDSKVYTSANDSAGLLNTGSGSFGYTDWIFIQKQELDDGVLKKLETTYDYGLTVSANEKNGTWSFDSGLWDDFLDVIIVLKAATNFTAFLLNTDVSSGTWSSPDHALSHFTVYARGDTPVPEPATFILLGSGLAGLAFYRRKRK